jgi:hypothetical protein
LSESAKSWLFELIAALACVRTILIALGGNAEREVPTPDLAAHPPMVDDYRKRTEHQGNGPYSY